MDPNNVTVTLVNALILHTALFTTDQNLTLPLNLTVQIENHKNNNPYDGWKGAEVLDEGVDEASTPASVVAVVNRYAEKRTNATQAR